MTCREMKETDIELLIPLYMNYYNGKEDGQWTVQTTYKRVHQVLTREDSYCLVLEEDQRIIVSQMGVLNRLLLRKD